MKSTRSNGKFSSGNQTRPFIFDLEIKKPELLYERVVEVDERVRLFKKTPSEQELKGRPFIDIMLFQLIINVIVTDNELVKGVTDEWVEILKKPNLDEIKVQLQVSLINS